VDALASETLPGAAASPTAGPTMARAAMASRTGNMYVGFERKRGTVAGTALQQGDARHIWEVERNDRH
jgi:hypothetical protein